MIAGAESTIAGAELSIGGGGARVTPKVYKLTPMVGGGGANVKLGQTTP